MNNVFEVCNHDGCENKIYKDINSQCPGCGKYFCGQHMYAIWKDYRKKDWIFLCEKCALPTNKSNDQ